MRRNVNILEVNRSGLDTHERFVLGIANVKVAGRSCAAYLDAGDAGLGHVEGHMQVARGRSLFDGYGQSDGRGLEELGDVEFVDLHGHRCRFALERAFGVNRRTVNLE